MRSSGQNHTAKCPKFTKSSTFRHFIKLKIKKITENLSFVLGVCIDNVIIVIQQVTQLVFWFTTACSITFSYKLRGHYAVITAGVKSLGGEKETVANDALQNKLCISRSPKLHSVTYSMETRKRFLFGISGIEYLYTHSIQRP